MNEIALVYIIGFCLTLTGGILFDKYLVRLEGKLGKRKVQRDLGYRDDFHQAIIALSFLAALAWFFTVPYFVGYQIYHRNRFKKEEE